MYRYTKIERPLLGPWLKACQALLVQHDQVHNKKCVCGNIWDANSYFYPIESISSRICFLSKLEVFLFEFFHKKSYRVNGSLIAAYGPDMIPR